MVKRKKKVGRQGKITFGRKFNDEEDMLNLPDTGLMVLHLSTILSMKAFVITIYNIHVHITMLTYGLRRFIY